MGNIHFDKKSSRLPAVFAVAAATLLAGAAWILTDDHDSVHLQSVEEKAKLKSGLATKIGPGLSIKQNLENEPKSEIHTSLESLKTLTQDELKEKQERAEYAKQYYEMLLRESNPIWRHDYLEVVRKAIEHDPDILNILGMSKDRFNDLVKSVGSQAGIPVLNRLKNAEKYDREKIVDVSRMKEIAETLSEGQRSSYYESLGSTQKEMQGYLCDGAVAEGRFFYSFVSAVAQKQQITRTEEASASNYLIILVNNLSGYKQICEAVNRDAYEEIGTSPEKLVETYKTYNPEIIPEPKP